MHQDCKLAWLLFAMVVCPILIIWRITYYKKCIYISWRKFDCSLLSSYTSWSSSVCDSFTNTQFNITAFHMTLKEYISAHLVHATKQSRPITALNFPVTYCTTPDSTHQPTQGNLLWSMNIPTQMYLGCERKPKYSYKTHAVTGSMYKVQADSTKDQDLAQAAWAVRQQICLLCRWRHVGKQLQKHRYAAYASPPPIWYVCSIVISHYRMLEQRIGLPG